MSFLKVLYRSFGILENLTAKCKVNISNKDYVRIVFNDNGNGILDENLTRVMNPFFTTKQSGKGTGLGLWVSYNIIKSFSGDIKVESRPGEGAAFTIYLPLVQS